MVQQREEGVKAVAVGDFPEGQTQVEGTDPSADLVIRLELDELLDLLTRLEVEREKLIRQLLRDYPDYVYEKQLPLLHALTAGIDGRPVLRL